MSNTIVENVSILSYRAPPSPQLIAKLRAAVEKYGPEVGPYTTLDVMRETFGHHTHIREHLFGLTGVCIYAECYVIVHALEGGGLGKKDVRDWYKALSVYQQNWVGHANIPMDFTVLQTYFEGGEDDGVFGTYSESDFMMGMGRELERMALLELAKGDTEVLPRQWLKDFENGLVEPSETLRLDLIHLLNVRVKFQQMHATMQGAK